MTHVPYATWCPICIKAKANEDRHKTSVLKDPAIQIDFNFGGTSGSVMRIILTSCDVQTGLISATVVPIQRGYEVLNNFSEELRNGGR